MWSARLVPAVVALRIADDDRRWFSPHPLSFLRVRPARIAATSPLNRHHIPIRQVICGCNRHRAIESKEARSATKRRPRPDAKARHSLCWPPKYRGHIHEGAQGKKGYCWNANPERYEGRGNGG